ncbi:hypothetical protein CVT25_008431 [Psilocybe cyanescens]|uniref:acylaminoacyl-peptidase n=1 Tax=Psilocybe cyanescens TaxID=93625 RepID=A0A409WUZ9_PSICY|nr:hypothetical protein CVT25_008431 [Psilocybe cyanescens]
MYTQLAEIPVPTGAHDHSRPAAVEITYSVKDHFRNTKRNMVKTIVFSSEATHGPVSVSTALQDVDIVAQIISPSTQRRAILRSPKSGSPRYVEIWKNGLLETSLDVTDLHGDFYSDEFLGSLSFSPSETSILYIAEAKAPESKDPFVKFRFNPDFGEGLSGKRRPAIFIFNWENPPSEDGDKRTLVQLKTDGDVRFGQAIFSANSDKIVYATGYEFTADGRILGIKGCFNRPSGIWRLKLASEPPTRTEETKIHPLNIDASVQKLTSPHLSCRSPRILSHNGRSTLIWLSSLSGGAHLASSTLYSLDVTSDSSKPLEIPSPHEPLVGIVDTPGPQTNGFPGLYPSYNILPDSSALSPTGLSVLVSSHWGSRTTVLQISLKDGLVRDLIPISTLYSWSVLATDGHSRVICSCSSPSLPYEIVLGEFDETGAISWRVLDKPELPDYVSSALQGIRTKIIRIPGRHLVETIVVQGANRGNGLIAPCIISPHGGPHGASTTAFSPTTAALVIEGYTISFPNYTGSPGYGEAFLQGLIGRCGELDVQDCIASARHLISIGISKEGPGMQLITGGSHGGFLTAHLIGQFPTFFSAAILRNPVISAGEISSSDIPDWYFSEFGFDYPVFSSSASKTNPPLLYPNPPLVTPMTFATLQAASPVAYIDAICVPVLLLIGAADRRVAPSQGIEYYHALKVRYAGRKEKGSKVEMLVFEGESHPLDGVEAAKASFEATKQWFAEAVNSKNHH